MSFCTQQAICQHCNHKWVAVYPIECESLQCSECDGYTAIKDMEDLLNPPLHLVVSRFTDGTFLKVSRECDRLYLAGLLAEVLTMITSSNTAIVKPEDCDLKVILTVEKPTYEP